jgi:hypothetical protein
MDSDIPVIEYYHEDEVHPAYCDHPNTTVKPLDVHTTSIHPPTETDDVIHMLDTFSDDELVERTQFYRSELGQLSDLGYNLMEPCNGSINPLRFNKLTRRCQYIESLQRHRTKYDAEDDTKEESGDRDEDEDDDETFPLTRRKKFTPVIATTITSLILSPSSHILMTMIPCTSFPNP